jgi:Icc-related predicted phosphoesterase
MRILAISDTHSKHKQIPKDWFPEADVLIHAGDISTRGYEREVVEFLEWFVMLPYENKILIAGNHDFYFQDEPERVRKLIAEVNEYHIGKSPFKKGIIYLEDSGCNIGGINFWGSPYQPRFFDWAFNEDRGDDIKFHWDLIPKNTDILITHGPAHEYCDLVPRGERVGCVDLREAIERIKPKYHICGHIHCAYGIDKNKDTTFINAAILNEEYQVENKPILFEYEKAVV